MMKPQCNEAVNWTESCIRANGFYGSTLRRSIVLLDPVCRMGVLYKYLGKSAKGTLNMVVLLEWSGLNRAHVTSRPFSHFFVRNKRKIGEERKNQLKEM